jgi:DNA polymerase-1
VDLNSPQDLGRLLYDELDYPCRRKTDKGQRSTDELALAYLEEDRPGVPGLVLEFRGLTKLRGTYITGVLNKLVDGRIHTDLKEGPATGRLASSGPNLQNVPTGAINGVKLREAYVPSHGCLFVDGDMSQIEIRLEAHISKARSLIDPILKDVDLHSEAASRLYRVKYEDVVAAKKAKEPSEPQKELVRARSICKMVNFGTIYGITARTLRANLKKQAGMEVTEVEAQKFLDAYWDMHPDVQAYNERLLSFVADKRFAPTLLGRKRPIAGVGGPFPDKHAENEALNTPIQGSAAELLKLKMLELEWDEELRRMGCSLLLQVHDELLFEVKRENAEDARQYVEERMSVSPVPLLVPTPAEVKIGENWAECK